MQLTSIFIDWDDTLCDFSISERNALFETFKMHNTIISSDVYKRYSYINKLCWQDFEKGNIQKEEIKYKRFHRLFQEYGYNWNITEFNECYLKNLSVQVPLFEDAEAVCKTLSDKYKLYVVTNGHKKSQHKRILLSGLNKYFTNIFVSEDAGAGKPSAVFWNYVFSNIDETDTNKMLIIGDSVSSDMQSGVNMNMHTCWVDRNNLTSTVKVDFKVKNLQDILELNI